MNSSLPINSILLEVLTKLDYTLEPPGFIGDGRTKQIMKNTLSKAIDAIGEESANAQGLKRVITTVEKLQDSPTHVLYVLKDPNGHYGEGEVIGILKVGKKHLYLYDELDSVHECEPLCVLDFFVKPERQRSGYGKFMFDYMLNDLKVDVNELAIDGPSPKMILFLQRNYGLDHMMRQTNNFAISTGFFANGSQNGGKKLNRKESPQATFGRYGARRPHSTVASVIHGENSHFESNPKLSPSAELVDSDLTEELEQLDLPSGGGLDHKTKRPSSSRPKTPLSLLHPTLAPLRPSTLHVVADSVAPLPAGMPSKVNKSNVVSVTLSSDPLLIDKTPAAGLPSSANHSAAELPFNIKKKTNTSSLNNTPMACFIDADKPIGDSSSKGNTQCLKVNAHTPAPVLSSKMAAGLRNNTTTELPSNGNVLLAPSFMANISTANMNNESTPAAYLSSTAETAAGDFNNTTVRPNNQTTRTGFLDLKFFHNPLW